MRPLWRDMLIAAWLGILLPGILLNGLAVLRQEEPMQETVSVQTEDQEMNEMTVMLRTGSGRTVERNMNDYLAGVLLAEMPATFEPEALKAQAVAARTYALKTSVSGGKHGDNSLCGDFTCCQGYIHMEDYRMNGGTEENLEKVREAVHTTSGEFLLYEGDLIEATYFSSSGGTTESALAVWGMDYPYLRSVESPEEPSIHVQRWSIEAFQLLLGKTLPEDVSQWIGTISYTDGGGVDKIEIDGEMYTGVQLRNMLGLRSTAFEIIPEKGLVSVITKGYGHRVGLSQYGANAMAQQGYDYMQILEHYYPGTEISCIS